MIVSKWFTVPLATSLVAALLVGASAAVQDEQEPQAKDGTTTSIDQVEVQDADQSVEESAAQATQSADEAVQSVEEEVRGTAEDRASMRRKALIDDAVEALDETEKALKALDERDAEAALESLAIATGKLDLVVARNPDMALAPVDVRVITYDLFATVDAIEKAKKEALAHMKAGRLQQARALIEDLRSDVVFEVVNVPLATYPAAIRAITPMIDEGDIDAAKAALQRGLNTLVITEHVHALPVIRAEHMLTRAEELAETEERSEGEGDELTTLLDGARRQLEIAQALGYGEEKDFSGYYEQLDEIAQKTSDGKSGSGFFDKIRAALRSFGDSSSSSS